ANRGSRSEDSHSDNIGKECGAIQSGADPVALDEVTRGSHVHAGVVSGDEVAGPSLRPTDQIARTAEDVDAGKAVPQASGAGDVRSDGVSLVWGVGAGGGKARPESGGG